MAFSSDFVSLGALVKLGSLQKQDVLEVANKPGRLEDLAVFAESWRAVESKKGVADAQSLRGKIRYAEGLSLGRVAAPLAHSLSLWTKEAHVRRVPSSLKQLIEVTIGSLVSIGPKTVRFGSTRPPIIVFSDGACEESGTSVGAVLFEYGHAPEFFGADLPIDLIESWYTKDLQKQVIGQAELFPLLVARLTWSERLRNRRALYFIDSESARWAMVKGYSPVFPSLMIVADCLSFDAKECSSAWYARVPTECNVADQPSRLWCRPC